jgi:hypothetical protein
MQTATRRRRGLRDTCSVVWKQQEGNFTASLALLRLCAYTRMVARLCLRHMIGITTTKLTDN